MKRKNRTYLPVLIVLMALFFGVGKLSAQTYNLAQFYYSDKPHSALNTSSLSKIDSLYANYLLEHGYIDADGAYKDFVFKYNYFLERLNKSGKIFSGDELSHYLNQLKDSILKNHSKKESIHVYLTNFDQLNAFTNDFGNIYVNVATLAKLDNEKELLIILAHEISHILLRHSFKMETFGNDLSSDEFSGINKISELDYHQFSRKQELEADSLAYSLLSKANINIEGLSSIFEKLEHSNNPIYRENVVLSDLCSDDYHSQKEYLQLIEDNIVETPLFSVIQDEDTLTTHPSATERKMLYFDQLNITYDSSVVYNILSDEKFSYYKDLASFVLLQTLITEHSYIEGLYLNVQLLKKFPESALLQKNRLKLLLLITQSKYLNNERPIVNIAGASCIDSSYLAFRKGILSMPALEMNVLTIIEVNHFINLIDDPYIARIQDYSYQFLYKHNPRFLIKSENQFRFNPSPYYINEIARKSILTGKEKRALDHSEALGFIVVNTLIRNEFLLDHFITGFDDYDNFMISVANYKKKRDFYESTLTLDQFVLNMNPDNVDKKLLKGEFINYQSISDSSRTVLIQSDTYVVKRSKEDETLDYSETLKLDEEITGLLHNGHYYTRNLSNKFVGNSTISVKENYLHHLLSVWIGECLNFDDLVYSVSDEEIQSYFNSIATKYVVYNFNIIKKSKKNKDYKCLFYDLYFDTETMGVVYVSKIASNRKPKSKYLRHFFYQSSVRKAL